MRAAMRLFTGTVLAPAAVMAGLILSPASLALSSAQAQGTTMPQGDDAAARAQIEAVLETQVAAWNRGDIPGFMHGYDASPDTTFVGAQVEHGYDAIFQRYQRTFSSRAKMGTLAFSTLETRLLSGNVAVTTGHFELSFAPVPNSSAPAPAAKSGIFSLVWVKRPAGWRIVLDHTS